MGFPNLGEDYLAERLLYRPDDVIVGVNLGRNKDTPNEIALLDYGSQLLHFASLADYLVINVSSPNTAGLRALQERNALEKLLCDVIFLRKSLIIPRKKIPILVKLSPDLDPHGLENAVGAVLSSGCDGIITTNTTVSRAGLGPRWEREGGGASGRILTEKSRDALAHTVALVQEKLPIISVGGIMDADEASRRLDMGASLVQLYTGFIFKGPRLIREILESIR
jgi:dihydroorotate dehydrogenase